MLYEVSCETGLKAEPAIKREKKEILSWYVFTTQYIQYGFCVLDDGRDREELWKVEKISLM